MPRKRFTWKLSRRRFAFWVGFGLFSLGERFRCGALDALAAETMRRTESDADSQGEAKPKRGATPEHWSAAQNRTWRWYERENFVDGRWKLTGITTPVNKATGELYTGGSGYLDPGLAPQERRGDNPQRSSVVDEETAARYAEHQADPDRRARHGRPPSKWLRSLRADELRIWLRTIEVPEAGVSGMTFWTHLTRDHSFDPEKIEGLTIDEQAKLHAAAHWGY